MGLAFGVRVAMDSSGEDGIGFAVSPGPGVQLPTVYFGSDYQEKSQTVPYGAFLGGSSVALSTQLGSNGQRVPFVVTGPSAGGGPHLQGFIASP